MRYPSPGLLIVYKICDSLYPKQGKTKGGQWIKAIHFTLPLSYHGKITKDIQRDEDSEIFQPKEKTSESVVKLARL